MAVRFSVVGAFVLIRIAVAAASVDHGGEDDDIKCLEHHLYHFIRFEAPRKIEQLLDEYKEKARQFGQNIQHHFRTAEEAVEHSFEHIKDRVPSGMRLVRSLAADERFRHFLSAKFTAEVMQMFSDEELQNACRLLTEKREVSENDEAKYLLGMLADRVETIGSKGARDITQKCDL